MFHLAYTILMEFVRISMTNYNISVGDEILARPTSGEVKLFYNLVDFSIGIDIRIDYGIAH